MNKFDIRENKLKEEYEYTLKRLKTEDQKRDLYLIYDFISNDEDRLYSEDKDVYDIFKFEYMHIFDRIRTYGMHNFRHQFESKEIDKRFEQLDELYDSGKVFADIYSEKHFLFFPY